MKDLDAVNYRDIDRHGMYESIYSYPEQIDEMSAWMKNFEIEINQNLKNVIFCGMGGSAITGDIVKDLLRNNAGIPIMVNRNSGVPGWVDTGTLAICVSYSGNTRETLNALRDAHLKGAQMVCISSGGKMEKLSQKYGFPHVKIKGGMQPRAALGYMLTASLFILYEVRVMGREIVDTLPKTLEVLRALREQINREVPAERNAAKKLAMKLVNGIPQIYAWDFYLPVARRWVTQLHENSKIHAEYKEVPECNHNHVVALDGEREKSKLFAPVFFRDSTEDEFIKENIEYLEEIYREHGVEVNEIYAKGGSILARMLYGIYFGDFVSYYLAIFRGIDPTPVDTIKKLKARLEKVP